ncbi:MAG: hypothetical protein AAF723_02620, partial [Pseudomonadota bacterium]
QKVRADLEKEIADLVKEQQELLNTLGISTEEVDENTKANEDNNDSLANAKVLLGDLQRQQSNLKKQIIDLALNGKGYNKELQEYNALTEKINKVNSIFSKRLRKQIAQSNLASDSIARLRKVVADLRKELEEEGSSNIEENTRKLIQAEKDLVNAEEELAQEALRGQNIFDIFSAVTVGRDRERAKLLTYLAEPFDHNNFLVFMADIESYHDNCGVIYGNKIINEAIEEKATTTTTDGINDATVILKSLKNSERNGDGG